jgi:hypothetical protein
MGGEIWKEMRYSAPGLTYRAMEKSAVHTAQPHAIGKRTKRRAAVQPDTLKIEGDWKAAVKKSLQKKKPAEG